MKIPSTLLVALLAAACSATSAFAGVSGSWYGSVVVRIDVDVDQTISPSAENFTRTQQKMQGVVTYDADGKGPGSYSTRGTSAYKTTGHEKEVYQCMKGGQGTQITDTVMSMSGQGSASGTVPVQFSAINVVDEGDGTYSLSPPDIPVLSYAVQGAATMSSSASCDRSGGGPPPTPMSGRDSVGVPKIDIIGHITSTSTLSGDYEAPALIPGRKTTFSWTLARAPSLKAKTTKAVYPVQRGDQVTLDATPSTGKIDEYDWTIVPGPDCFIHNGLMPASPLKVAQMTGKTVTFTALCGVIAQLKVKNSVAAALTTTTVQVSPRTGWKTAITPPTGQHGVFAADFVKENAFLGKNRCTLDAAEASHWLHTSKPGAWEGDGYALKQVSEPGAPFDGFWYVSGQTLRISRKSLHSSALLKGGVLSDLNSGKNGNPKDLATLLAQVDAHEDMHTTLVLEYFAQQGADWDPAAHLEPLFYSVRSDETASADYAVGSVEQQLDEIDWETLVGKRLQQDSRFADGGWVEAPTVGGPNERWDIASFATLQSANEGIPGAADAGALTPTPVPTAVPAPSAGPQLGDPPVIVPYNGVESGSPPSTDQ